MKLQMWQRILLGIVPWLVLVAVLYHMMAGASEYDPLCLQERQEYCKGLGGVPVSELFHICVQHVRSGGADCANLSSYIFGVVLSSLFGGTACIIASISAATFQ